MPAGPGIIANLIHQLIAALDTGKYQDITVEEVEARIRAGDLFPYLIQTLGEDADLSLFDVDSPGLSEGERSRARTYTTAINERLLTILHAYGGQEGEWGIERNGLCLLLTWGVFILKLQAAQRRVNLKQSAEAAERG